MKHLNQEEAQLLATPPMHQNSTYSKSESFKDYSRNMTMKHKLKTRKEKHPEGWNKKKHRSKREPHYNKKSVTLYFAFMNIVLEIQTKS